MAIIKCSECGKEISSTAEQCPNCGCKTAYGKNLSGNKAWAGIKIVGVILLIVGTILWLPACITLIQEGGDWYFWNWDTSYAYATVAKFIIGMILDIVGSSLLFLKKKQEPTNPVT